jgi:hypothetical protein
VITTSVPAQLGRGRRAVVPGATSRDFWRAPPRRRPDQTTRTAAQPGRLDALRRELERIRARARARSARKVARQSAPNRDHGHHALRGGKLARLIRGEPRARLSCEGANGRDKGVVVEPSRRQTPKYVRHDANVRPRANRHFTIDPPRSSGGPTKEATRANLQVEDDRRNKRTREEAIKKRPKPRVSRRFAAIKRSLLALK